MKWRIGDVGRPGPTGAVPGIRRSLSGRRRVLSPSAVPGSATRVAENQRQRQVQRQRRRQRQGQGQRRGPVRPRCPDTAPGHRGRSRTEPHRKTRSCGSVWDRSSDSGSPEARCGHGDRSSVTGSVTDQGVAENQRQGQRQGQGQRQRGARYGHGFRSRPPVTGVGHGPRPPRSTTSRCGPGCQPAQTPPLFSDSDGILRTENRTTLRVGDLSTRRLGRGDMGGATQRASSAHQ
jgi:hypothetical protein